MTSLVPCAGCARHVRATDATCPFCATPRVVATPSRAVALPRMRRVKTFALGAAIAGSMIAGCDDGAGTPVDSGTRDTGVDAGSTGGDPAPAPDTGVDEDAGMDAGTADAGTDAATSDAGTDSGEPDAEIDAGGIAPPYGAPGT